MHRGLIGLTGGGMDAPERNTGIFLYESVYICLGKLALKEGYMRRKTLMGYEHGRI